MEADKNGVTAKNTYGGPLLLRTEFSGDSETTYEYLYNAHGDVVTLISDEAVVATYYYDSFGNVLDQTGEVSNSILYAGYQYDEETGLYYINARMYDPVTARFLQADTYLGNTNDPLSLNLYTYCLNNPHKYTDPSGHFAITAAAALLIARIGISLISGVLSAKAEYDRQIAEGDNYTIWGSVLFVGVANAGISYLTFGIGQGAAVAGVGAKAVLKHVGKAVIRDAAIGALTDAGIETARQLVTGTKITNLEYDRIAEAGAVGGIVGGASTIAGAALEGLMKTRVAQKALAKVNLAANKGWDAIQNSFAKVARKNGKTVGMEAVTELKEPGFKMDLQRFASDEGYESRSNASIWKRFKNSLFGKREVPVENVYFNPKDDVFRRKPGGFDDDSLNFQVEYINRYGKVYRSKDDVLTAYDLGDGTFMLQNGHHRLGAARKVGLQTITIEKVIPYDVAVKEGIIDLPRGLKPKEY